MSQSESRFGDGVFLGLVVGGILGGVLGVLFVNRSQSSANNSENLGTETSTNTDQVLDDAKRSLEEKITQLNDAIESARERLINLEPKPSDE